MRAVSFFGETVGLATTGAGAGAGLGTAEDSAGLIDVVSFLGCTGAAGLGGAAGAGGAGFDTAGEGTAADTGGLSADGAAGTCGAEGGLGSEGTEGALGGRGVLSAAGLGGEMLGEVGGVGIAPGPLFLGMLIRTVSRFTGVIPPGPGVGLRGRLMRTVSFLGASDEDLSVLVGILSSAINVIEG